MWFYSHLPLPSESNPFYFWCRAVRLSGAAFPLPLLPLSVHSTSFCLQQPSQLSTVGRRVGRRVSYGENPKAARKGICCSPLLSPALAYCLEPDVLYINLHIIWDLSTQHFFSRSTGLSEGGWFIENRVIHLLSVTTRPKNLLHKIRLEDNNGLDPSSVKIYYVLDSVPF